MALLLGLAGTTLASTSTANADIFGVSDAVEDWICGIVSPNETWESVGEGTRKSHQQKKSRRVVVRRRPSWSLPPGNASPATRSAPTHPPAWSTSPAQPAGQPATVRRLHQRARRLCTTNRR